MSEKSEAELAAYAAARKFADAAAAHADKILSLGGHERYGGLWSDDASDYLYARKDMMSRPVYLFACELVEEMCLRNRGVL